MSNEKKKDEEQLFPLPRRLLDVDEDDAGKVLFYFHEVGDYLYGILRGIQKRQSFHYTVATYLMAVFEARQDGRDMIVENENLVEFPANLKLRRILEDHELIGSRLRIIYKGRRGRYKNYEVFKDKGTFYPNEEQKHGRTRKKTTSKRSDRTRKQTKTGKRKVAAN